ncbi:MAG: hypothetical protein ACLS9K_11480 [Lachnospira eligens]
MYLLFLSVIEAKVPANASSTEETSSVNGTDADGNNTLSDKDEKELDPQYSDTDGSMNQSAGNGASVVLSNSTNETSDITIGIDVSKFQGTRDWAQVASSGVDFAMIRVGYRAQKTGVIYADTNAKYNMQQLRPTELKLVYTSSHQQLMKLKLLKKQTGLLIS